MKKSFVSLSFILLSCSLCVAQITPQNDSLFSRQKAMFEKIGVFEAWEKTKGSSEVVIGCIDNGFDFYHPYLHGQLTPGYWAEGAYHTEVYQNIAHGTLVSSIMAAKPEREEGMHGLAPGCRVLTASLGTIEHFLLRRSREIMKANPGMSRIDAMKEVGKDSVAVREFSRRWMDYVAGAVKNSIIYLVDNGVRVINLSAYTFMPELNEAFEYARAHDVLMVVAAGNGDHEIPDVLPNRDNVIVVGATDKNDSRWTITMGGITEGSNYGEVLDVCAPCQYMVVCKPSDPRYYKSDDGPFGSENIPGAVDICDVMPYGATSAATPVVTSLAALIYSIAPDMTAAEVKSAILDGADDIGEPGFDIYTGHGRINFGKTISLVSARM